ncbi:MAG: ATP-binding cassette domain-containing protein [Bdellovibrionota bacterium]
MIEFVNLSKNFNKKNSNFQALNNINLTVQQGEIFGIVGKSGAGKSTLLRCANLLEKPSFGNIILDGVNLNSLSEKELRLKRRKIGMVFQHFNLLTHSTVFKNIALPLEVAGFSKKEIKDRVDYLLKVVDLSEKINSYPDELSGGQKQRVAIARALANSPSVLLCDEVTSALDAQTSKSVLNLLKKINKEFGVTILLITHQIEVVQYICHRVAVIEKGGLVEVSKKEEFMQEPKSREGKSLIFSHDFSSEMAVSFI